MKDFIYVTSSEYKREEAVIVGELPLDDGRIVRDVFGSFEFHSLSLMETLEVDIKQMVEAEVVQAYSQTRVPCIVEHAGLVWQDYASVKYPGGLTKPMWNALGDRFLEETNAGGRRAYAQAWVAYCDGKDVLSYRGQTSGTIALEIRGRRQFYWDTIFVPDQPDGKAGELTYAEIVDSVSLSEKVVNFSQSRKALMAFLNEHAQSPSRPWLWP